MIDKYLCFFSFTRGANPSSIKKAPFLALFASTNCWYAPGVCWFSLSLSEIESYKDKQTTGGEPQRIFQIKCFKKNKKLNSV